jgi:SAM-dependent methyltransferase
VSGFAPRWLALREPYDHRARSRALALALAARLPRDRPAALVDLACGTGSSLRYLAPLLGGEQRWRLYDIDPALLAAAGSALEGWESGAPVRRAPGGASGPGWSARWEARDLRGQLLALTEGADAVVTSALLDLVSAPWLEELADACAARRLPLLAALTVDGRLRWTPRDRADEAVAAAFRAHQRTDRGWGPSPGPAAAAACAALLEARGFAVRLERTDWRIPAGHTEMLLEMIEGVAGAAAEVSPRPGAVQRWRRRRLARAAAGVLSLEVGHADLLAWPL